MKYRIPLAVDAMADEEKAAVLRVLDSGRYTQGQIVEEFERNLASYIGVEHAIMVNSGSSANLVAITAVYYLSYFYPELANGVMKSGDEVIIPGLCWPTTITPILNLGLRPVFCDIDTNSLNATVECVEAVRTLRTRAVVAVPVLGNPTGLNELSEYCDAEGLIFIEDACESMGAESISGKRSGSFGMVGAFSFYFSHHITTIEGGCIVTDSTILADLCRSLRSHGWARNLPETVKRRLIEKSDKVDPRFEFILPGYNVRATEITAAIGIAQLKRFSQFLEERRRIASSRISYLEPFADYVQVPGRDIRRRHSWMAFPLLFSSSQSKDLCQKHFESHGVETRPIIAGNIIRQPMYRFMGVQESEELEACDCVFERGLMLGLSPIASDLDEEYLESVFKEALYVASIRGQK